ncbi:amino acid permease [Ktedonosporobacter rubrisoli]|uniref:Amino acid permease n=1 Tax=Ktedonosporobacter rubrisoli TaxID=2509675 RepID=A0A4P6K6H8_KTERU|nr:amino acid permease [Ktedonosporobacter rubrisoli]
MGYAQELFRAMGGFSNFAISFTIISVLSGCLTLFYSGITTSGFAAGSIGWPLVTIFVVIVALGMAELASAFPTAGGLYYWASKLGGPAWGWFTGWFNLIGQVAVTAGIDYGLAVSIDVLLNAWFPHFPATLGSVSGIDPATQWATLGIYAVVLIAHAILNIFGVRIVAFLNDLSVWWHIVGVCLIGGGVVVAALLHPSAPLNSAATLFAADPKYNASGFPAWYAFLLGLLMAQYTYTGFDASAHMTEETIGAETRAPWGVVMSVVVSAFAGYLVLMGLLMAAPDIGVKGAAGAINPVLYILEYRLGAVLGPLFFAVAVGAQFFCGMSSITTNSRMIYAFSRDGAVPFSRLWHQLDSGRTPRNAIILSATCAFVLAIPTVFNYVAYVAITSIAVIGLYISYVLPILLRVLTRSFKHGPWHLGSWGKPIGVIAVLWVICIAILFMLPTVNPITIVTFNYTPIVVLGTLLILVIWWTVSVRHWFKGPKIQGSATELANIERDVGETVLLDGEETASSH